MDAAEALAAARLALAEYNAAYEAGGEIEYPHWADQVLKNQTTTEDV